MRDFVKKYGHVDFIQWLTKEGASKMIEAVKNIYTKQQKEGTRNAR